MQLFNGLKNKFSSSFVRATGIIFLSSGVVNVSNLLFWLYMVRKLSTTDYGDLNSLLSLFMIISLPVSSLQTVVTKFVSQFYSQGNYDKMHIFLFYLGRLILAFACSLFILLILFSRQIASFMNVSSTSLVIITSIGLFFSTIYLIPAGTLQGLQHFLLLAVIGILAGLAKLVFGIVLVASGFRVMGAMLGFIVSAFIGLILTVFNLPKELISSKTKHVVSDKVVNFRSISKYFVPVAIGLLSFGVLTNFDIILVKHYFPKLDAGYYSVAQTVGKIILFLPAAISIVMFPKAAYSHAQSKDTITILRKSLLIVGVLCFGAAVISVLFPGFVLKVLTGKVALQCIPLVKVFVCAMSFFALVQILMYYHLSVHNFKFIFFLAFFALAQIILITIFHASLINVIYILLFSAVLLFISGMKLVDFRVSAK